MKRVALFLCGLLLACAAGLSTGDAYAQQSGKAARRAYPKPVFSAPLTHEVVTKIGLKAPRVNIDQTSPNAKAIRAKTPFSDR